MIGNILERTRRKIKLGQVLLKDGTFTTDEQDVEDRIFNTPFPDNGIPEEWIVSMNMDESIYDHQLDDVTMDILVQCPNNKAEGVSVPFLSKNSYSSTTYA